MKLAEALVSKSHYEKSISELVDRINASGRIQEGDVAPDNVPELLIKLEETYDKLTVLSKKIIHTNLSKSTTTSWLGQRLRA